MKSYVYNEFEFFFGSDEIRNQIRNLLLHAEDGTLNFTMERFLQRPNIDNKEYVNNWCRTVWVRQTISPVL